MSLSTTDPSILLIDVLTDIVQHQHEFRYKGPAHDIFGALGEDFALWLLEAQIHQLKATFLLPKDDAIPMIESWQLHYCDSLVSQISHSVLEYDNKTYHLRLVDGIVEVEQQPKAVDTGAELEWQGSGDDLPQFMELKSHLIDPLPSEYYHIDWQIDDATLAQISAQQLPGFVLNLARIEQNYRHFTESLPEYKVYYSIKSNPDMEVLRLLQGIGSGFEAVSFKEIERAFEAGAPASDIIFSAPVKRIQDIKQAHIHGIKIFVADSREEISKLAKAAPESQVVLRIKTCNAAAKILLSAKYGAEKSDVIDLFEYALECKLIPWGITLHVGGQNEDPTSWLDAQQSVHELFVDAQQRNIHLSLVNIGGGFPIALHSKVPSLSAIAKTLTASQRPPLQYCAEPGRVIVGDAGKLVSPVIAVVKRLDGIWLYVDASIFGSLFMMGMHAFEYPISSNVSHLELMSYHIASMSCDGRDVICKDVLLPKGIKVNHLIYFHLVGAYSLPVFDVAYAGVSKTRIYYQK